MFLEIHQDSGCLLARVLGVDVQVSINVQDQVHVNIIVNVAVEG